MARSSVLLVALAAWLSLSCAEKPRNSPAVTTQEDADLKKEMASRESELKVALAVTREIASGDVKVRLHEVVNPFDVRYEGAKSNPNVAGYPVVRSTELSGGQVTPLVRLLTDRGSFAAPGEEWMCLFEPHHVLELRRGDQVSTVVICTKCGDVVYIVQGKAIGLRSLTRETNGEIREILARLLPSTDA